MIVSSTAHLGGKVLGGSLALLEAVLEAAGHGLHMPIDSSVGGIQKGFQKEQTPNGNNARKRTIYIYRCHDELMKTTVSLYLKTLIMTHNLFRTRESALSSRFRSKTSKAAAQNKRIRTCLHLVCTYKCSAYHRKASTQERDTLIEIPHNDRTWAHSYYFFNFET